MSYTIIDINGIDYAAYASVAEADRHLAVDPAQRDAWAARDEATKGVNLIAATRRLDGLRWRGRKTDPKQENAWPRSGLTYRDGTRVPDDAIPREIEQATILMAGGLALNPDLLTSMGPSDADIQSERIGPMSVTYFHRRESALAREVGGSEVLALIGPWLDGGANAGTGPAATGTDGRSAFEDANHYGRTGGFA